jgi:hypothetical protein
MNPKGFKVCGRNIRNRWSCCLERGHRGAHARWTPEAREAMWAEYIARAENQEQAAVRRAEQEAAQVSK